MAVQHKELTGDELHQPMRKGNDADKSSSPIAGDWFLALDTEKIYVCYDDGVWDELSPVDVVKLIGDQTIAGQKTFSDLLTINDTLVVNGSIDLSADIDVDGTLETDAITLNGAAVNSANGLLKLDTSGKVVSSQMPSTAVKLKVGSYAGNSSGSNRSITGIGFQPLFVLIYKAGGSYGDFVKGAGDSGSKQIGSNNYYTTEGIVSFDSDGFTIKAASGNNVNESGYTYYYMAIG